MRAYIAAIVLAVFGIGAFAETVVGNGKVGTERRTLPAFASISIGGSGRLNVHRGPQKVEISCDSNLLPYITTEVSERRLAVGWKPFTNAMRMTKLVVDITVPSLEGLSVSGSADAFVDSFEGPEINVKLSGSGSFTGELRYRAASLSTSGSGSFDILGSFDALDFRCSGSGDARLRGTAGSLSASLRGSGRLEAAGLATRDASVEISGACDAEIRAKDSLVARLTGSGRLAYWGDPRLDAKASGAGSVRRLGP